MVIFWKISIHKSIKLKNPVTTASGIFCSGREYGELIDLNRLGAITVKGVSEEAWKGNSVPRVAEKFADCDIALLELNISCPNVEEGGLIKHISMKYGGEVYVEKEYPQIEYLSDQPAVYELCGYKTFAILGAYSVDKWYQLSHGWTWYEDEQ